LFEQLALALKNRFALEFFNVLKYILSFRIFEQLALALKCSVWPGIFHCIACVIFISQDFLVICACHEKQSLAWNFSLY